MTADTRPDSIPDLVAMKAAGRPIVMLSDCPTTGGYPVIAVVTAESMCDVAQWSGGPRTFRRA